MRSFDTGSLREALAVSWGADTSYRSAYTLGNPALGQCYPTSRVVQRLFPVFEVVKGSVDTGRGVECHFWNVTNDRGHLRQVDLTWQQFPAGSVVQDRFEVLGRGALGDSAATIRRCELLLRRVISVLDGGWHPNPSVPLGADVPAAIGQPLRA